MASSAVRYVSCITYRDDTSVLPRLNSRQDQPKGASMKIYLMMLMVGALFTAIRFTTVQDKNSTSLPQ